MLTVFAKEKGFAKILYTLKKRRHDGQNKF